MALPTIETRPRTFRTLPLIFALITAALGLLALLGWILGLPPMASFATGLRPMSPSTALLLLLNGAAIVLRVRTPLSRSAFWISVTAGGLVSLVAGLLFALSTLNIHPKMEHFGLNILGTVGGVNIGHMSPVTALCFLLTSVSFLASLTRSVIRPWRTVLALGSAAVLVGTVFVLLLAYLFDAPLLYVNTFIPPALNTLLAFITLGLALLVLGNRVGEWRDRSPDTSARTALHFFLIFLVLAVGIVAAGYSYYRNHERAYRAAADSQLLSIAELKVGELIQWREDRLGDGAIFFKNPSFSDLVRRCLEQPAAADASQQVLDWLHKYSTLEDYDQVRLMDAQAVTRLLLPGGLNPASVDTVRAASECLRLGRITIQDFYRHEHDRRVYLSVQIPIFDGSEPNRPLGVVVLRIDPAKYLYPFIQRWPTPSATAETLLVRREGNEVLFLNELRFRTNTVLNLREPLDNVAGPEAQAALGREGIMDGIDYQGKSVVAAMRTVPNSPWALVARMDSAEVRAPMLAQLWQVIAVIGAMLFGAAAGVGLVWRQQRVRFYRQEAESMAALRLMRFSVERASDALFWMTADARIVDVNTAACRSLGYTREEMLQLRAPDVDIHYSAEKWPQLFAELRQRGSMTFESEQRTKDGRLFPVETVANYVTQDNEEYNCVFVRDITERKKAVDALREAEWKFQALFEKGPIGVAYHKMIYDASGKPIDYLFLDANDACLKLTGVDPRGKTVTEAFPGIENDPFDYIGKYGRVARTGEELRFESYLQVNGQWYDVVCYQYKPDHFVAAFVNITTRKQAEEALRQSEFRWKFAVDGSGDGLWDWDVLSGTVFFSRRWKEMLGFAEEEIGSGRDEWSKRVHPDDRTRVMAEVQAHLAGTTPHYISEHRVSCKDGAWKWMLDRGVVLSRDADGKPLRVIGTQSDITERRLAVEKHDKLQSLLIQAQKMESVGRLAGGIAHDFNNLLMGIMNYVDLCRDALEADHPTRGYLDEITVNAERSANLTRQLIAFARKQTIAPTVLDLNDAVVGMLKMLEQLLGENVSMTWVPGARLWQVKVDPSQVDQIMANLCVNARDAIAGVGRLIIETSNVVADERYCAGNAGAVPGEYVQLAVSDTGHGMGKDVLEHIFEPFFTTKEVGKGTGLGLATVYGIAVQNKGFITVYSEPGKGTTFKIHFPRSEAPSAAAPVAAAPSVLPRGSETILLVEDEKSVRVTTHMFLEDLGYKVLVADDPGKALGLAAQYSGDIDLLITDVIMPNMSGRHLADQLCLTRPSTRRLFMSGFTADVIAREGVLEDGVQFLTKPFGRETLARKVREVLECGDEERSM